jgi:hypothetical protein
MATHLLCDESVVKFRLCVSCMDNPLCGLQATTHIIHDFKMTIQTLSLRGGKTLNRLVDG